MNALVTVGVMGKHSGDGRWAIPKIIRQTVALKVNNARIVGDSRRWLRVRRRKSPRQPSSPHTCNGAVLSNCSWNSTLDRQNYPMKYQNTLSTDLFVGVHLNSEFIKPSAELLEPRRRSNFNDSHTYVPFRPRRSVMEDPTFFSTWNRWPVILGSISCCWCFHYHSWWPTTHVGYVVLLNNW